MKFASREIASLTRPATRSRPSVCVLCSSANASARTSKFVVRRPSSAPRSTARTPPPASLGDDDRAHASPFVTIVCRRAHQLPSEKCAKVFKYRKTVINDNLNCRGDRIAKSISLLCVCVSAKHTRNSHTQTAPTIHNTTIRKYGTHTHTHHHHRTIIIARSRRRRRHHHQHIGHRVMMSVCCARTKEL